jgi:hypothetical protein
MIATAGCGLTSKGSPPKARGASSSTPTTSRLLHCATTTGKSCSSSSAPRPPRCGASLSSTVQDRPARQGARRGQPARLDGVQHEARLEGGVPAGAERIATRGAGQPQRQRALSHPFRTSASSHARAPRRRVSFPDIELHGLFGCELRDAFWLHIGRFGRLLPRAFRSKR